MQRARTMGAGVAVAGALGVRRHAVGGGQIAEFGVACVPRVALRDGTVEQPLGERGHGQEVDHAGACGLARDGDAVRVAAEVRDVVAHPAQDGDAVEQSVVSRGPVCRLGAQLGGGQKAEGAQAVVEGDDDEAVTGQVLAVVAGVRPGTFAESAPVDPDEDRAPLRAVVRTCPDVQVQAVLAQGHVDAGRGRLGRCLWAHGTETVRLPGPLPAHGRPRGPEAQAADGRGGVGDASEDADGLVPAQDAFDGSRFGVRGGAAHSVLSAPPARQLMSGCGDLSSSNALRAEPTWWRIAAFAASGLRVTMARKMAWCSSSDPVLGCCADRFRYCRITSG